MYLKKYMANKAFSPLGGVENLLNLWQYTFVLIVFSTAVMFYLAAYNIHKERYYKRVT